MDFKKLTWLDRSLMNMLKNMLLKKKHEELTQDEKGLLSVYDKSVDFTDKSMIKPLVEAVLKA